MSVRYSLLIRLRLYCTNLPDKLRKPDLRLSLYTLFSTYGPVLDVVAVKNKKMRGQAHVVFRDIQASTQAMRALQGFDFFGNEMVRHCSKRLEDCLMLELSRKSSTPKAARISSRNFAARSKCQQLLQELLLQQNSKSLSSMRPHQQRQPSLPHSLQLQPPL